MFVAAYPLNVPAGVRVQPFLVLNASAFTRVLIVWPNSPAALTSTFASPARTGRHLLRTIE